MSSTRDLYEMERIHDLAAHSPDDFLANPINAYLLVKRLTVDWADLQDVMTDNSMGKGASLQGLADSFNACSFARHHLLCTCMFSVCLYLSSFV